MRYDVRGLDWRANGTAALSGDLLAYAEQLDRRFLALAARWGAVEMRFPPLIVAADLHRIDYFASFPHLVTFAAGLDPAEANLEAFRAGPRVVDGEARLTQLAPVTDVLTPAACYPIYISAAGRRFDGPAYVTVSATCFRREAEYVPLERQWAFTMREVVCLGTADNVRAFVAEATGAVDELRGSLGIPAAWDDATDPFFQPSRNPKAVMQLLDPVKRELLFDGRLAIGSTNLHHDSFGRSYDLTGPDGAPVHTGCVAFGLERWLAALAATHGGDPADWPAPGERA